MEPANLQAYKYEKTEREREKTESLVLSLNQRISGLERKVIESPIAHHLTYPK